MSVHLGFYNTATTRTHVGFQFSTMASAGGNVAPSSAIDAADIRIYRAADGAAFSATQRSSSSGITCTSPFDSLTGFHDVDIDLTDNTDSGFYASGYRYSVVLAPNDETIDSLVITGVVLAYFEIGIAKADVTQFGGTNGTFSGGRPEVNTTHWGGTAVASANVLIDGAITAAKIGADAITDAKVASDVTIASVTGAVGSVTGNVGGNVVGSVASVTGNVGGNVVGSVGSVAAGGIASTSFAAGAITAASIAADAITDAKVASDVTIASVTGAVGSVTGNVGGNVVGSVGSVVGSVGSVTSGVTVTTNNDKSGYSLSASAIQAIWDALTSALTTVGSVGKLLVDNINATISSRSSQTSLDTLDDYVDTEVAAIKAKTDNLPASPAATSDIPSSGAIADAVWDEVLSGHLTAGSTGNALNAAGSAVDPWSTSLPGAYGAGTAGKIVGDNLNATVSSRASQTSVDTIDDFLDTEIAAILADTNELQTDWANGGRLDLLLDAILADTGTDGVVISTATANAIADALLDRTAGVETNRTLRQSLRIILASAAGKLSGAATNTVTIRDTNDSKDRITATVDSSGNRSSVTLDAT